MLCPTVLGRIEKEEKQKGKGSLRSRWNRDGQESVGILSFSLWAEHHCTLEGGGYVIERPDDTGEGPDEVSPGWESMKLDVTTKKAEFQRNETLLLYLFLVWKCEQGLSGQFNCDKSNI